MNWLLLYIPLGALGFARWLSWLIRQIPATLYRPVVNEFRLPMTVVVPVYQEEPQVFRDALRSWLVNDVEEVICVVDETDHELAAIAREHDRVRVIVTSVPGKRDALRRGWEAARTPLVALVDSDTIWAADVATQIRMPFADRGVGGVTARQNVSDPRTVWQHLNDMYLDYRYSHELPSQSAAGQALSCLSGRTAVYRRVLLEKMSDRFMTETFWGVPCLSGDDKRLSMLLLEDGYQTVLQRTARVWSLFPKDARTFFKQRLRWSRNTWRSDLRALTSGWVYRHPFLAYWMLDKAIGGFTLLLAPVFMTLSLLNRHFLTAGILAVWWMFSRSAKMLYHLERRPSHMITVMPIYIVISFALSAVKLGALLSVRRQRWLTRDVKVSAKQRQVVRTLKPAEPEKVSA
jgi:cellulose synthase/poly-beta-1,6-N-acetylglucosamine synthase-like glycosyltransferase